MGFKGSSVHTINSSGRISIPSKIRDVMRGRYDSDDQLVLAIGRNYLVAFPTVEWEKYREFLSQNPSQTQRDANMLRKLYASLEDVTLDKQGRILISTELREAVNLKDECMIVGLSNRIEIWDKAQWDAEMAVFDEEDDEAGSQFNLLML